MVVPFAKFTTKKWVVLASKIDQLFIGVGMIIDQDFPSTHPSIRLSFMIYLA